MIRRYDKSHQSGARPPDDGGKSKGEPEALPPESDFEQLFQSLYDAAILSDLSGRILHANRRATDFLLFTRAELCEMTILDVVSGTDASLFATLHDNLEGGRFTMVQAHCIRKDKSTFPSEITVNKLQLRKECFVFFIRAVTDRAR